MLEVVQAFQEEGNMGKVLPDYLSQWTTDKVRSEGVTVVPNSRIKTVSKGEEGKLKVEMESGNSIATDHIVIAVGVEPDLELARATPMLVMKKKVIISRAPQRGSISFPTSMTVKMSTTTSQKRISRKQCESAVQIQKCGGGGG